MEEVGFEILKILKNWEILQSQFENLKKIQKLQKCPFKSWKS